MKCVYFISFIIGNEPQIVAENPINCRICIPFRYIYTSLSSLNTITNISGVHPDWVNQTRSYGDKLFHVFSCVFLKTSEKLTIYESKRIFFIIWWTNWKIFLIIWWFCNFFNFPQNIILHIFLLCWQNQKKNLQKNLLNVIRKCVLLNVT